MAGLRTQLISTVARRKKVTDGDDCCLFCHYVCGPALFVRVKTLTSILKVISDSDQSKVHLILHSICCPRFVSVVAWQPSNEMLLHVKFFF